LDAEQVSNILSIIGGTEQSNADWTKTNKNTPIWSYCEDIDDNRGFTIGIAGFTTEDGSAASLMTNYGSGMPNAKNGKAFCAWAKQHSMDPKLIAANWKSYYDGKDAGYIKMVKKYRPAVAKSAVSVGLMLDCAMNAGEFKEGDSHYGLAENVKAAQNAKTELEWCNLFIKSRLAHWTKNTPNKEQRMGSWQKLIKDQKWDMKVDVCPYMFCDGKCGGCPKR